MMTIKNFQPVQTAWDAVCTDGRQGLKAVLRTCEAGQGLLAAVRRELSDRRARSRNTEKQPQRAHRVKFLRYLAWLPGGGQDHPQ